MKLEWLTFIQFVLCYPFSKLALAQDDMPQAKLQPKYQISRKMSGAYVVTTIYHNATHVYNGTVAEHGISMSNSTETFSGVRASLFPNVPPYYKFVRYNESVLPWPQDVQKHLTWKFRSLRKAIIVMTVNSSGFTITRNRGNFESEVDMKQNKYFKTLRRHVKFNLTPGSSNLGSKVFLWLNLRQAIVQYGRRAYNFVPETFILPENLAVFDETWDTKNCNSGKCMWIAKPPNRSYGNGIIVSNSYDQITSNTNETVVQEYIKPYLINGRKFDLRLYVLVTSFRPLRIYLYKDGFVRFAAHKYSSDTEKATVRRIHLTNRRVNQGSRLFVKNNDPSSAKGNEWSVKAFWRYFREQGIATGPIMKRIENLIIKTLIATEPSVTKHSKLLHSRYSTYHVYGFDIGLGQNLKPWLFEVNITPGMAVDSGFLLSLKGNLVTEYMNIAGYHFPPNLTDSEKNTIQQRLGNETLSKTVFDRKLYSNTMSKRTARKVEKFQKADANRSYIPRILGRLTAADLRQLITAEDELTQCNGFKRIFPSERSHRFLKYFPHPQYFNLLLDAWETKYGKNRTEGIERLKTACQAGLHLKK